jgi:hypothetical protein
LFIVVALSLGQSMPRYSVFLLASRVPSFYGIVFRDFYPIGERRRGLSVNSSDTLPAPAPDHGSATPPPQRSPVYQFISIG